MEQITENPYLQYFIRLSGYQEEALFDTSTLVLFCKRISAEMLMELNEYLLANKDDDNNGNMPPSSEDSGDNDAPEEDKNERDASLHWMQSAHQQISVIRLYLTIITLYEQQQYMYDNKTHSVEQHIVSISQPWLRPIVRGKTKVPVEFGAKFDLSLNSEGYGRIEKILFEVYNESGYLIKAVERFRERTGYYLRCVLVDQIYRTRENWRYCKDHGIRLSGSKLGRPSARANAKVDKK